MYDCARYDKQESVVSWAVSQALELIRAREIITQGNTITISMEINKSAPDVEDSPDVPGQEGLHLLEDPSMQQPKERAVPTTCHSKHPDRWVLDSVIQGNF